VGGGEPGVGVRTGQSRRRCVCCASKIK
jgi:hypothetical protein